MKARLFKVLVAAVLSSILVGCGGGGGTSSGGGSDAQLTGLVGCAPTQGTITTNNCTFAVNIRFLGSDISGANPTELIRLLQPGETLDVSPFDSQTLSGVPACMAPLAPTMIIGATSIGCE